MINRNQAQQIRACERIKFDQALYILTMYEKKIRKSRKSIPGVIDADTEMQDIVSSWKNKWKMDLTKPILNCVTSVYPRILVDHSRQDNEQLANYYDLINRFITRLRAEHEDETNFKMVLQTYDKQLEYMTEDKYQASTKATVKGLLTMSRNLADLQITSLLENFDIIGKENLDVNTNNLQWQVLRPLRYIKEITSKALLGESEMEVENDIEPKCEKTQSLIAFCTNVVKIMERIKQSQHGSTLITIQPKIDQLTLVFHPLLVAIASNFKKQNNQKLKEIVWSKVDVQSIPMMQNLKNSYNSSRVVLINLDGYQSEFNLQIVRNFKKHLLYVSFPKEQAKLDEAKEIYSKRFFKKLMFRYSQSLFSSFNEAQMNEDYRALTMMERLNFNPEDYHCHAEKLYQTKNDKSAQDFNQNLYVFPIRMGILRQKFPQIFESKDDIQNHESYFIRFIIKDFLLNQIREFNPTLIMISYSGRIHIEDHHFVQLMQEFTKIANYKVLLFPNLTSAFVDSEMIQAEDKDGEQCDYDNFICDSRISAAFKPVSECEQSWTDLFNKLSRFLKVSSGTYNLSRSFEEQALVSKYKNQFILTYIDDLMTVLGKEYYNIDKIRFRNRDLSILPKLFEENIRSIKKTFEHTVPKLYSDIYEVIEYLLLDRQRKPNPKKQQLIQDYSIDISQYFPYIQQLYDQLASKSNFQIYVTDYEAIGDQIQKLKIAKMREVFNNQKESHLFQISSEKYEDKANIFIKTEPENKEYPSIIDQTQSLKGLFETSFYINPGKVSLKIFDSTKLLYQIDQRHRKNNRIPLLIMNNLTDGCDHSFQNYYTEIDISNAYQTADKKTFQERKCLAQPIFFQNEQGIQQGKKKTQILAQWNYHQSSDYLILYWPSKYDFFRAFLMKMMNKPYQPEILNEVYFCKKGLKTAVFRKVALVVDYDLPARMGTSSYQFQGKVFIFGGFYEKQKNYLQMQHDIVTFDLRVFEQAGQNKLPVCNIKSQLYGSAIFQQRLANKQKQNSFIRPRIQFQFFDKEQLYNEQQILPEQGVKTVVMIGGYGQNFIRPYSLLTYYYYLLRFETGTRNLTNIEKRIIYNKAIPVNTREMTKNLGVIKTNKKNKSSVLQTKKLTDPDAYTIYRNSFKIDIKDGEQDFNYKFKYMFSEDQYKNFKHEIKKIYQLKVEEFDSSSITVERDLKNNHRITLEKDGKKKEVQLRMEIPLQRAKKIEGNPKQVSLTHQSIIYLDSCNSIISAIVKHDKYTQGKSVLVEYNTKCLEGFNFDQDDISHLAMTWIKQFDFDLTLHILIICNKNTVAILHGQKLQMIDSLKQFIVKRKKNKNEIAAFDIKDRQQLLRKNESTCLINTIFFRNRNKIISIDFVVSDSSYFYICWQQIELNVSNDVYRWEASSLEKIDPTIKYEFCLSEKNFVRMDQLRFVQFFKNSGNTQYYLVVQHNRKKYICDMNLNKQVLELVQQGSMKIQTENMERGVILVKTEDKYNDRNFF